MVPVDGHLVKTDGTLAEFSLASIRAVLAARELLWLDFADTGPETLEVLIDDFGFHPLAVEDAHDFGQRPKIEDYGSFVSLVAYGAPGTEGEPTEGHFFYTREYLVTVHRGPLILIGDACNSVRRAGGGPVSALRALYHVLDGMADTMFPYLEAFDDRIDTLRDMMSSLLGGRFMLPGMTEDEERYFRDLYDHMIRISDLVDSYRDLLSGAMDTHLSTVSNRLNQVMKQLTIIATIFLPLSFLTGFFGQNFGWMVGKLGSLTAFLALA